MTLADENAKLKVTRQNILADEATKTATIADLTKQRDDANTARDEALANAATPEQLAEMDANIELLNSAIAVAQKPPTDGTATAG